MTSETIRSPRTEAATFPCKCDDIPNSECTEADVSRQLERELIATARELRAFRRLAKRVCLFDWSSNDSDAALAIDRLREALGL
jgi:hypothetical protein